MDDWHNEVMGKVSPEKVALMTPGPWTVQLEEALHVWN